MVSLSESRRFRIRHWFQKGATEQEAAKQTGLPLAVVQRHYDALLDEAAGGRTPDYHLEKSTEGKGNATKAGPSHLWTGTRPDRRVKKSGPDSFSVPATKQTLSRAGVGGRKASSETDLEEKKADTSRCGTTAGWSWHIRFKTEICDPCKAARAEYQKANYKPRPPRKTATCGTYGGYMSHTRKKTPPCDACREARQEYRKKTSEAAQAAADDRDEQDST